MNIIDIILELYSRTIDYPMFLKRMRIDSIVRFIIRFILSRLLPYYYLIKKSSNILRYNQSDKRKIVVSLTSFPARINIVWLVIESLIRQNHKPNKIILWLSKEQFQSMNDLPKKLIHQQKKGLEIRFVDGDIRSHKKYAYVAEEFKDDFVVLVDDDIIYPSDFIESLLLGMGSGNRVNFSYGHIMKYSQDFKLLSYNLWETSNKKTESSNLFFGSGGGIMFIPSTLYGDCWNIELAMRLCPTADDVWLNAMCKLSGLKCVKVRKGLIFTIGQECAPTLCSVNVGLNQNDIQIDNVRKYYIKKLGKDPFAKD